MRKNRPVGFTLPEVLVSVVITGLIFGVVISILITSTRLWRRCSSMSEAFPPAYAVVNRINKELKNAYYVTVPAAKNSITFRLPRTDADGINLVPLQPGTEVTYYRSDATGLNTHTGTTLWRRATNLQTNAVRLRSLAENVEELTFNCDATQAGRVFSVYSTAVTVVGQEQATTFESRFQTTMAIRNPAPAVP